MDERICLSKTENGSRALACASRRAVIRSEMGIYERAITRLKGGISEAEIGWSAASEGVLAALRLSKSAQSADKVHFSDSEELSCWSSGKRCAVSVVSGH